MVGTTGTPWVTGFDVAKTVGAVHITLANDSALLNVIMSLFVIALGCFLLRSPMPILFSLFLPLTFTKRRWTFQRLGPTVTHQTLLFGRTLREVQYPLGRPDAADTEVIEDSLFAIRRPRWYRALLYSDAKAKSYTLARTPDRDMLDKLCGAVNEAIREVRESAP